VCLVCRARWEGPDDRCRLTAR